MDHGTGYHNIREPGPAADATDSRRRGVDHGARAARCASAV